jgi:hypothetical protein
MNDREKQILKLIPKDVKKVLDIGSQNNIFNRYYDTICLDITEADINQDLNKNQRIPLKDSSVDCVVLSQILEHLTDVSQIIKESKRVSKKYILIGMPNEITLDNRIRILVGKPLWKGYLIYFHKHYFTIDTIEDFIKNFFGEYERKEHIFGVKGGRFLPLKIRKFIARIIPSLAAKEVYYLVRLKK